MTRENRLREEIAVLERSISSAAIRAERRDGRERVALT